jgi:hypothetical protein
VLPVTAWGIRVAKGAPCNSMGHKISKDCCPDQQGIELQRKSFRPAKRKFSTKVLSSQVLPTTAEGMIHSNIITIVVNDKYEKVSLYISAGEQDETRQKC